MKKKLIPIFILVLSCLIVGQSAKAQNALWLYLVVDKADKVSLDSFDVLPEEFGGIWNEGVSSTNAFEARVLDSSGKILNKAYFIPSFLLLSDPPMELDETITEVVFPYSQNIKTVQVLKAGKVILTQLIGGKLCNRDYTCNNSENYLSCPSDCGKYSKDSFCNSVSNDGFCDRDCDWDTEVGSECTKPNCNDKIKNQDETSIDTGGICLKLKCENGIQDTGEGGIDCGGVCSQWWQCSQDFCGDGICAEYESGIDCSADCGELISILKNTGTQPLSGYLLMKVQMYSTFGWKDYETVFKDTGLRTIQPGEIVNLKEIWNNQNYTAKAKTGEGKLRIYAGFLDNQEKVLISDTAEFFVGEQKATAPEPQPQPQPEPTGLKGTIYEIQKGIANFFRDVSSFFDVRLWR